MSTKWTRNQKIAVGGIAATSIVAIIGMFVRSEIKINYMEGEIGQLRVKSAEIDRLKLTVAHISELITSQLQIQQIGQKMPTRNKTTNGDNAL